jgi:uncharacterized membrane protein (UPF0127 family)
MKQDFLIALLIAALLECAFVAGGLAILRPGNTATLETGGRSFLLDVANTPASREQGLGGRQALAASQGLLFVFGGSDSECFWMKGMRFPLDIIWLSNSKKVAYIESNVEPATYPKQFCPAVPTAYGIELNAGTAQAAGIQLGQTLKF